MAQNPRRKSYSGFCGSFCRGLNAVKAPLPNLSYLEPAGETGVLLPFRIKSTPLELLEVLGGLWSRYPRHCLWQVYSNW